jgi:hypothetical protein
MKYLLTILYLLAGDFIVSLGQANYNVLPWKSANTLNTWLLHQVHAQYEKRDSAFSLALTSRERLAEYRVLCQRRYKAFLGEFPAKTPVNPTLVGEINMRGFRIEKVIFESLPNHHVTSNLYIPKGKGPFPAVLLLCGHEAAAKATESYQQTAQLFALNGFVVLVVDPVSQGERYQLLDTWGRPATRGGTTEHTLLNAGSNLVGTSIAAYELFDNIRALDYLEMRKEVDKNRIGCLGNSGGGTQTVYLIAYDERIRVAAPCSYVAQRERNLELAGASDGCQHIPYEGAMGLEIEDFLIAFAPKPLLILAGRFDFVDYYGVVRVGNNLRKVYNLFGKPNHFELFSWDDGHGISKPKRERAVTFFRTHLCDDTTKIIENNLEVLSESQLNCTIPGQVVSAYPDELTIQKQNILLADRSIAERKRFLMLEDKTRKAILSRLIGYIDTPLIPEAEVIHQAESDTCFLSKLILRVPGQLPIPCLVYRPKEEEFLSGVTVILNEEGKAMAASSDKVSSSIRDGRIVVVADLRGVGETFDKSEQNDPKYWNQEYRNAMISLHLGQTLTGQRVADLVSIIKYIKTEYGNQFDPITIHANGLYGPVAIYAAIFEPSVKSVCVSGSVNTYYEFLENPLTNNAYSYVIPSLLRYFDIPELVEWIGSDRITFVRNK